MVSRDTAGGNSFQLAAILSRSGPEPCLSSDRAWSVGTAGLPHRRAAIHLTRGYFRRIEMTKSLRAALAALCLASPAVAGPVTTIALSDKAAPGGTTGPSGTIQFGATQINEAGQ